MIRFDDLRTRQRRKKRDNFCHVRESFEHIVGNFQKNFTPSEQMTIDEQLLPFRGRCRFKQYTPSKPARYGIKTFALVDAKSYYTYNLETYVGLQKHPIFATSNTPHDLVLRLVDPIKKTGRNITADNWFTSFPLIKELAKLDLSYVGTMKKNKREIPLEFQPLKSREFTSSLFGFHQAEENLNVTMVSYIPEKKKKGKKKAVVMLSTMMTKLITKVHNISRK